MRQRARTSEDWAIFVRKRRGAESRSAFGARVERSDAYISQWENYGRVPTRETIIEVAEALGATRPINAAAAVIVTDTAAALTTATVPPEVRRQILRRHIAALVLREGSETGEEGFDLTLRPVT